MSKLYVTVFIHFQLTAKIAVVKLEGPPYLCKSDEVGELCISSGATGSAYWGLAGKTNHTFKVIVSLNGCTGFNYRGLNFLSKPRYSQKS